MEWEGLDIRGKTQNDSPVYVLLESLDFPVYESPGSQGSLIMHTTSILYVTIRSSFKKKTEVQSFVRLSL